MLQRRLRYRDLEALGIVTNRTTMLNWIRDRGFPTGQLTGPNQRTWGEDEVQAWLDSRPTAPRKAKVTPYALRKPGRPRKARDSDEATVI